MVTRTKRRPVKNIRQINLLTPEKVEYKNPVEGIDCLYVKVSPNGARRFVTSLTVSKRIALPKGQSRQKSFTHGLVTQFSMTEIKQRHQEVYTRFKNGQDIRHLLAKDQADQKRTSLLNCPIVELSLDRLNRKLKRGEINNGENDRLYTKRIQEVIGDASFQLFSQSHADALATAYPPTDKWTTADKVKKLIKKIYNDLPSDARQALEKDIPQYLENAFGRIRQRKRSDQVIDPQDIGAMWVKMLEADVNPIFKDAWVFMLLTGERKSAVLKAKRDEVRITDGYPEFIYLETKGDASGPNHNLIPTFGVLAMLVDRLVRASEAIDSPYLFPSQKGSGHLTSIRPLIDTIGEIGDRENRSNPHNLRRTIANLARDILGSTELADEHLLHFKSHMTGSKENYFSLNAESFAKTRLETYQKIYRHLDDLILWSGGIGYLDREIWPQVDAMESKFVGKSVCRDFISLGSHHIWFNHGEGKKRIGVFEDNGSDFHDNAKVWSPVASFCSQSDQFVFLKNRSLTYDKLMNEWMNYGEAAPRFLRDEID